MFLKLMGREVFVQLLMIFILLQVGFGLVNANAEENKEVVSVDIDTGFNNQRQSAGIQDPTKPYGFLTDTTGTVVVDSLFELTAIFYSRKARFAKINGEKVEEGNAVDGALVTEIKPRYVILQVGSVLQKMELKREKVSIVKR